MRMWRIGRRRCHTCISGLLANETWPSGVKLQCITLATKDPGGGRFSLAEGMGAGGGRSLWNSSFSNTTRHGARFPPPAVCWGPLFIHLPPPCRSWLQKTGLHLRPHRLRGSQDPQCLKNPTNNNYARKLGALCTVGENAKLCSHCGRQCGDSSKN